MQKSVMAILDREIFDYEYRKQMQLDIPGTASVTTLMTWQSCPPYTVPSLPLCA